MVFTSTKTISFKKTIHALPDAVLALLHDPKVLFAANPLIAGVIQDPSKPHTYTITDTLVVLGYFTTTTKYTAQLDLHKDGVDTAVVASLGTRLRGQYRIRAGENGTTVLEEDTAVEGFSLMMPYIIKTMAPAHEQILESVAAKAENRDSRHMKQLSRSEMSARIFLLAAVISACLVPCIYPYTTSLSLFAVIVSLLSLLGVRTKMGDPYSLFHLSLNKLGEDVPPKTEWLNMGYWQPCSLKLVQVTIKFREQKYNSLTSCCGLEALATKLIQAAQCKTGDSILDVGYGTGESVILLLSEPSIPRPSLIIGVTSLSSHHIRAEKRVERILAHQESKVDPPTRVLLHCADAVHQPGQASPSHPLGPSSTVKYNGILALDCAYHFNTRWTFLEQSLEKLASGGRIALADICFDPDILKRSRTAWAASKLFQLMPKANMVSPKDYVARMMEMGYVDVQLEDISQDVFPGFVRFLKAREIGWKVFGLTLEWYAGLGAKFIIVSGARV
ncbi:hypothetical protein DXG03_007077 [Asterophora parasitica]|uniref:DUF7053 domain-containing protein n=1 Tax=Asterophora parasitica TaxID=117018 RepID=A0A9P7GJB8_9AGAR|nr:hypothetical protein DXG03_007077 [Asterophora parasitica]